MKPEDVKTGIKVRILGHKLMWREWTDYCKACIRANGNNSCVDNTRTIMTDIENNTRIVCRTDSRHVYNCRYAFDEVEAIT